MKSWAQGLLFFLCLFNSNLSQSQSSSLWNYPEPVLKQSSSGLQVVLKQSSWSLQANDFQAVYSQKTCCIPDTESKAISMIPLFIFLAIKFKCKRCQLIRYTEKSSFDDSWENSKKYLLFSGNSIYTINSNVNGILIL